MNKISKKSSQGLRLLDSWSTFVKSSSFIQQNFQQFVHELYYSVQKDSKEMMNVRFLNFYLVFIAVLISVVLMVRGLDNTNDCQSAKCASDGPEVRFPFLIEGKQPDHCGYPYPPYWFDLSCSETNKTLLQLSSSCNLSITHIDYTNQIISANFSESCLPKGLLCFNMPLSPFLFDTNDVEHDYTLFGNCSREFEVPPAISCLSNLHSKVYPVVSSELEYHLDIAMSCFKMQDISSFPDQYFYQDSSFLELRWNNPNCRSCEAKGKRCRVKSNFIQSQIECYEGPRPEFPVTKFIATGVTLGSVLLLGAIFLVHRFYRRMKFEVDYQAKIQRFLDDYKSFKPTRFSYAHLKRMTNRFKDKLGKGAYGTVYKGKLSPEIPVAVKLLDNSEGNGEEFINEVRTIGRIHHVNVVRLIGFCSDGFRQALVYEYLPNESLQKYISSLDAKNHFLGWKRLENIALGIAKGIEYLHQGCDQRILHFDIKPQNILLDHDFNPKVSDFGLAKLCGKDQSAVSMTTAKGTVGYMAPEVFSRNFGNVSYKCDVYSFGMVVLEMVGGRKIVEEAKGNDEQIYFPEWIYNLLEEGEDLRVEIEEEEDGKIAKKLAIVGLWCIQWNPMDRPSMKLVLKMLEEDGESLTVPPNPFSSTASGSSSNTKLPRKRLPLEMDVIQETE